MFRIIAQIPGVLAVEKLVMSGVFSNGHEHPKNHGPWIYKLAPNHYPRANFERSCFNFSKNRTPIAGISITRQLALSRERLTIPRKTSVSTAAQPGLTSLPGEVSPSPYSRFDKPISLGNYRSDLGTFVSVQNDFPVIYGIGEGHLIEMETPNDQLDERQKIRKAQALQLKSYLLFFDQLLANYAAQLANLRHLFSLMPDDDPARTAAMQHTAFVQKPDSVPLLEQLLRFYEDTANIAHQEGDPLVVPVHAQRLQQVIKWLQDDTQQSRNLELGYLDFERFEDLEQTPDCKTKGDTYILKQATFSLAYQRDGLVEQWGRDFRQNSILVETLQDACGFYFLLWSEDKALAMLSRHQYETAEAALQASQDVLMLGTLPEIFRRLNMPAAEPPLNLPPADKDNYTFEIVFRQADYISFLQSLLEDETLYCKRRNQFLDHILARFCERFTDHATLRYEAFLDQDKTQKRYKNDKARYAQHYDDYSRNRGRAFDYTRRSWDTNNISGLEAKTAALAGIPNFKRNGICITSEQCDQDGFYYQWTDYLGATLFRSPDNYPDIQTAHAAFQELVAAVKAGDKFQIARSANGEYRLSIVLESKQIVPFGKSFPDEASGKKAMLDLAWSLGATVGNTVVRPTKDAWRLDVINHEGGIVRKVDKVFATKKAAESGLKLIETKGLKFAGKPNGKPAAMQLVFSAVASDRYLDLQAFQPGVFKLPKTYFWQRFPSGNRSTESWEKREQVLPGFAAAIEQGNITDFFQIEKKDRAWRIILQNKKRETLLEGTDFYPDEQRCKLAWRSWRQAAVSGKITVEPTGDGAARVALSDANGQVLARSRDLSEIVAADYPDVCLALLNQKTPDPTLEKLDRTFYGFHFDDDKGITLLASFKLFDSALEAFHAMQLSPAFAQKKENYVLTGDEGNPDYTYLLRDKHENYIGYLPDTLESPAERNNRQKKAIAWFVKWEAPVVVLQEADRFSFQWNDPATEVPLVSAETSYLDENEATQAFALAILSNEAHKGNTEQHLYSFRPVAYDVEWNFVFQTNLKGLTPESISFTSVAPFDTIGKAEQAANTLATKLANAKPVAADSGKQAVIQIKTGGNGTLIQSFPFESVAERDKALAALRRWIKWSGSVVSAANAVIQTPPATPAPVPNAALSAQNPFILQLTLNESSCLKILKHDEPMAVHPDGEWVLEPGDKNCQKWYYKFAWKTWKEEEEKAMKAALKINCGLSFFLEICLDGTGVTEKTLDCPAKYRFVFRNLKPFEAGHALVPVGQILWQSVQTYETPEEAIAAFQTHYLNLMAIVSNIRNYGGQGCIRFEEKPAEPPLVVSTESCACQDAEVQPGIEVPWSTLTLFDGVESTAAYFLSEAALSYPVFSVINEAEQCGCGCAEDAECHCKKTKTSDDLCADPSKPQASKFKFRLYNFGSGQQNKPGLVRWESTACYETVSEAMSWFKVFSRLLEHSSAANCLENCHVVSACCACDEFSIGIAEVMLKAAPKGAYNTGSASQTSASNAIDLIFKAIKSPEAFQFLYIPQQLSSPLASIARNDCGIAYTPDCFSFCIAEEGYRFAAHPGLFSHRSEALAAAKKAFEKVGTQLDVCRIVEKSAIPARGLYFLKTARKDGFVIQLMCVNKTVIPASLDARKYCPPDDNLFGSEDILLLETTSVYFDPPCATPNQIDKYAQEIVGQFCALLIDFSNFVLPATDGCESPTFELCDPSKIVARHPICYATAAEAQAAIQRAKDCLYQESFYLLENILMRPGPMPQGGTRSEEPCPGLLLPASAECCLEWLPKAKAGCPEPEGPEQYLPFTDPYSFWATVVIPCYTARFCQADFRRFFEETLRYEAPAHIALCYRWLSPSDICKFEKLYKKWLAWKSDCKPKTSGRDNPECALLEFLQAVEDCPADPKIEETHACCDCEEKDPVGEPRPAPIMPRELPRDCKMPDEVICKSLFKPKSETK